MRRCERILLALVCAAVGWFYCWTAHSNGRDWHSGQRQTDYYNLLIDGWLAGQLNLKVDVPDVLLRLPDPYDPAQRPPDAGLHDASFYRGRYYLYFGVAPAALTMLPWRLTGAALPLGAAVVVFALGGFLAGVAVLRAVRRTYFPETGTGGLLLAVLALGLAGLGPVLVRRAQIWELPIAGGYCFGMLALGCVWRALHTRRAAGWMTGAGVCLGLAIASRATYLVATPLLLAPIVFWWRERRVPPWRETLAAALPLAAIGALLALHNYLRFGDLFEFGQKYQLSSMYEARETHFALRYVPLNAWLYFWAPAHWTRYFPFLAGIVRPAEVRGYGGWADVYGVFANLPVAWFVLAAPLAFWRRTAAARRRLGAWLAAPLAMCVANATLLLFFFGAHGRYMLDFVPALMLLACVGGLALGRTGRLAPRPGQRFVAVTAWTGAVLFSAGFALLFSLTATQIFREKNPRGFEQMARRLNRVPAWFERLAGTRFGPVELTVRLPPIAAPGTRQVLLTTGVAPRRDAVFVQYAKAGRVEFGVFEEGGATLFSRALPLDLASPHRVRLALGSLYPPKTHPFFAGLPDDRVAALRRELRIEVDDEIVLDAERSFFPSTPDDTRIAPRSHEHALGWPFTGEIVAVKRTDAAPAAAGPAPLACVRLRLKVDAAAGEQPLLSAGAPGRGDVLLLTPANGDEVRFTWRASGSPPVTSAPVALELNRVHEFLIRLAEPTEPEPGAATRTTIVQAIVDGTLVWSRRVPCAHSSGDAWAVGRNVAVDAGSDAGASTFAGRIFSQEQFPQDADPLVDRRGPIALTLHFPPAPRSGREPLVVTGHPGAGDFLFVEYVDAHAVRFGLDHWGESRRMISEAIPVDFAATHEISIALGSLADERPKTAGVSVRRDRMSVVLDGREVWKLDAAFYGPGPGEVYVGRNPIGGSSCGPAFTGEILSARRERPAQD